MKYESSANDVIRFHLVRRRRTQRRRRPRGIHFRAKPFMGVVFRLPANEKQISCAHCKSMNSDGFCHMVHSHIPIRKIWCAWEQTNWLNYSWAKISAVDGRVLHDKTTKFLFQLLTIPTHTLQTAQNRWRPVECAAMRFENDSFAATQEPNKWKKESQLHGYSIYIRQVVTECNVSQVRNKSWDKEMEKNVHFFCLDPSL